MKATPKILRPFSLPGEITCHIDSRNVAKQLLTFSFLLGVLIGGVFSPLAVTSVNASPHQVKLLEIPLPQGTIPKVLSFPLYEQNAIQYFSAGLGKEERSLTYPPFSLKLIFIEGARAYLAAVTVDIKKEDGTLLLTVPADEVEGPWLFINLPSGRYEIHVTDSNDTTIKKTIAVPASGQRVSHFRFS